MRETGYYWVKISTIWQIANYNRITLLWTITAYDGILHEYEFAEIDEKQIIRND